MGVVISGPATEKYSKSHTLDLRQTIFANQIAQIGDLNQS